MLLKNLVLTFFDLSSLFTIVISNYFNDGYGKPGCTIFLLGNPDLRAWHRPPPLAGSFLRFWPRLMVQEHICSRTICDGPRLIWRNGALGALFKRTQFQEICYLLLLLEQCVFQIWSWSIHRYLIKEYSSRLLLAQDIFD